MKQSQIIKQEEWLRVLTKGMVTIPKAWRDEFGLNEGDVIKAKKLQDKIVLEPVKPVDYRVYNRKELQQFIKDDTISYNLSKKLNRKFKKK